MLYIIVITDHGEEGATAIRKMEANSKGEVIEKLFSYGGMLSAYAGSENENLFELWINDINQIKDIKEGWND